MKQCQCGYIKYTCLKKKQSKILFLNEKKIQMKKNFPDVSFGQLDYLYMHRNIGIYALFKYVMRKKLLLNNFSQARIFFFLFKLSEQKWYSVFGRIPLYMYSYMLRDINCIIFGFFQISNAKTKDFSQIQKTVKSTFGAQIAVHQIWASLLTTLRVHQDQFLINSPILAITPEMLSALPLNRRQQLRKYSYAT